MFNRTNPPRPGDFRQRRPAPPRSTRSTIPPRPTNVSLGSSPRRPRPSSFSGPSNYSSGFSAGRPQPSRPRPARPTRRRKNPFSVILIVLLVMFGLYSLSFLSPDTTSPSDPAPMGDVSLPTPKPIEPEQTPDPEPADPKPAEKPEPKPADKPVSADSDIYYYYSTLSRKDRAAYEKLLTGLQNWEATISLPGMDHAQADLIIEMLLADRPDLFWGRNGYSYREWDDKLEVMFQYQDNRQDVEQSMQQIQSVLNTVRSQLPPGSSEYDTIRYVYDYVIRSVSYELGAPHNQDIRSSLINRRTVCSGYARAMQYLLQNLGIQTIFVQGTADGDGGWDRHAWNIVRCNGRYYQLDATFDDGYERASKLPSAPFSTYTYFCVDDTSMYRDHKPDTKIPLPPCTSNDLNYYVLSGRYSDQYDSRVADNMKQSLQKGEPIWFYQFSNAAAYNACINDLTPNAYMDAAKEINGTYPDQVFNLYIDKNYTLYYYFQAFG